MSDLLTDEEMLQVIWDMGRQLESEGKEINQAERFNAIAKAQNAKTKKGLVKWLEDNFHIRTMPDTFGSHIYIEITGLTEKWQALKKEVKDG